MEKLNLPNKNIETPSHEEAEKYMQQLKESARRSGSAKLYCYNWMRDIQSPQIHQDIVEVRFKNTRKDFYVNDQQISLEVGDVVTVEVPTGHDVGVVSLMGELVRLQIAKVYPKKAPDTFCKIYRKAKPTDIEKWKEAKALEHKTMIRARQIAKDLKLNMKIGDVEYQGDKMKAIFYYIAEERVDFRELIKVFAEEFKVRIEMRQIGVRQEAGRIGGIGLCGRDLCCSSFISNFNSVSTNAARYQEVSLNPQKMAGQCGKLKCCLNFELASYMDARKHFPDTNIALEFGGGRAYHAKTDVYKALMTYVYKKDDISTFVELPVERVKEIISLNKKGVKPENLQDTSIKEPVAQMPDYENVVGQESLTRFDKKKKKQKNFNGNQQNTQGNAQNNAQPQNQSRQNQPSPNNNPNNQRRQQQQSQQPQQQNRNQQRNGNQFRNSQNRDRNNSNNNRQPNQPNDGKTEA